MLFIKLCQCIDCHRSGCLTAVFIW